MAYVYWLKWFCEYFNTVLKIYEQSAKDTWNTNRLRKKKKILKGWIAQKKGKTHFWKSFNYIEFGYETEGKKGWKCLFKRRFSNVLTLFLGINSIISIIIETRSYVCSLGVGVILSRYFARNRGRGIIVICRHNIVTQTVARKYNTPYIILHLPIVLQHLRVFFNALFASSHCYIYAFFTTCDSIKQSF